MAGVTSQMLRASIAPALTWSDVELNSRPRLLLGGFDSPSRCTASSSPSLPANIALCLGLQLPITAIPKSGSRQSPAARKAVRPHHEAWVAVGSHCQGAPCTGTSTTVPCTPACEHPTAQTIARSAARALTEMVGQTMDGNRQTGNTVAAESSASEPICDKSCGGAGTKVADAGEAGAVVAEPRATESGTCEQVAATSGAT